MTELSINAITNGVKFFIFSAGSCFCIATGFAQDANDNNDMNKSSNVVCERIIDHTSVTNDASNNVNRWYSLNDNVMGGKSVGTFSQKNDHLHFHGSINTDGGGFASIRRKISAEPFSNVDRIRLAVQSDKRAYSVQLQDENGTQQSISHRAPIAVKATDDYEVIEIQLKDLVPMFRGRNIQAAKFNTATARTIGIMLSDSIDGPFNLKLAWIDVCRVIQ